MLLYTRILSFITYSETGALYASLTYLLDLETSSKIWTFVLFVLSKVTVEQLLDYLPRQTRLFSECSVLFFSFSFVAFLPFL
jgi:hypothetical protein